MVFFNNQESQTFTGTQVLHENANEVTSADLDGNGRDDLIMTLATPTSCLLLTNGKEPIEYVRYEAEQEQVPIVLVESNTLATMAALETLVDGAKFDHPLKMKRFAELMQSNLDMDAILSRL